MPMNPITGTGVPGGMSSSMLGLGVVLSLHDMFSKQATRAQQSMRGLQASAVNLTDQIAAQQVRLQSGMALLLTGVVALGALSLPVKEAVRFEEALARVSVITDKISEADLSSLVIDLANIFPEDPTAIAGALRTTIASGIDDPAKAAALARQANKLAIGTQSRLDASIEGLTSIVNAYGSGLSDNYTTNEAEREFEKIASVTFDAMKFGKFSDVSDITDLEALFKQIGQVVPIANTLNIPYAELMANLAVGTLSGQNARRQITAQRQAFIDILNRSRTPTSMPNFLNWAKEEGINMYGGDLTRFITEQGYTNFLGVMRDYVGIQDTERLSALLSTEGFQNKMTDILAALPEDMGIADAMDSDAGFAELMNALQDAGGVDIAKANEVFQSVWGLNAVLPMLGNQWNKLQEVNDELTKASDSSTRAFNKVMETVGMLYRLAVSKMGTVLTLLGLPTLTNLRVVLKGLNFILDGFIVSMKNMTWIPELLTSIVFGFAALTTSLGIFLTFSAGFKLASLQFTAMITKMPMLASIFGASLSAAFSRFFILSAALALAFYVVKQAWKHDIYGMRTQMEEFRRKSAIVIKGLSDLWTNYRETGTAFISETFMNELKEENLDGVVARLAMWRFRLEEFFSGLGYGFGQYYAAIIRHTETFVSFMQSYGRALYWIFAPVTVPLDYLLKAIRWLGHATGLLVKPVGENVTSWRAWGVALGNVLAWLIPVNLLLGLIGIKATWLPKMLAKAAVSLTGLALKVGGWAFAGLAGLSAMFWWITAIVVAVAGLTYAYANNTLGFRDWVESSGVLLKEFFQLNEMVTHLEWVFDHIGNMIFDISSSITRQITFLLEDAVNQIVGLANTARTSMNWLPGVDVAPIAEADFTGRVGLEPQQESALSAMIAGNEYLQSLLAQAVDPNDSSNFAKGAVITGYEMENLANAIRLFAEKEEQPILVQIGEHVIARVVRDTISKNRLSGATHYNGLSTGGLVR